MNTAFDLQEARELDARTSDRNRGATTLARAERAGLCARLRLAELAGSSSSSSSSSIRAVPRR